ncbi:MAG: hypothetical protein NTV84_04665 [Methanoregula sp.]|nr:hypothetical protein [Methanoregula sp.]
MMDAPGMQQRVLALASRFNEPVIPQERIQRWLARFTDEEKPVALALLEKITFHTYPCLIRETRQLHAILREQLAADGFDSCTCATVDFTRGFTCKSGDIISYIYRKANAVPSVDFKTFDRLSGELAQCTGQFCDRALVILDDYTGTGSQFIFQFLARNREGIRLLKGYRKVYLASIVIHDNAFCKLELLQRGECKQVLTIEEGQFPDYDWDWEEKDLCAVLGNVDWTRVQFICVEREHSLLSPLNRFVTAQERELLGEFLRKYGGDSTLTTSYLDGHHAFFYGAPNSLPKILLPLFSRIEDLTIYPMEHFLGDFPFVTCLDMDDDAQ